MSSHSGFFLLMKPTGHPLLKKSHYEGGAVIGAFDPKNWRSAVQFKRVYCLSLRPKTLSISYSLSILLDSNQLTRLTFGLALTRRCKSQSVLPHNTKNGGLEAWDFHPRTSSLIRLSIRLKRVLRHF